MTEPKDVGAAVDALARMSRILERTLRDISLADFRMLTAVAGGEARASRLATRLSLGKPTVSASVDSLVRRGLLERSTNAEDQRVAMLAITAEGRRMRDEAEAELARVVGALAADTGDPAGTLAAVAGLGDAIERRWSAIAAERAAARSTGVGRHAAVPAENAVPIQNPVPAENPVPVEGSVPVPVTRSAP